MPPLAASQKLMNLGSSGRFLSSRDSSGFSGFKNHQLISPQQKLSLSSSSGPRSFGAVEFDVDVRTGFLPSSQPISRLNVSPWSDWEDALDLMKGFRVGIGEEDRSEVFRWRDHIRRGLSVIDIEPLKIDIAQLRRAHVVLAFLTHTYVHLEHPDQSSSHGFKVLVPSSLAIPFCAVSDALQMPPILTYADTVLYNWRLIDDSLGFMASNIEIPTTFTDTESEVHFFKTSVLVEVLGPKCLSLMRSSLDEAFLGDELSIRRISNNLNHLSRMIDQISKVLQDVRTDCDPRTFYWEIRPWFNGGEWVMEGVRSPENQRRRNNGEGSDWLVSKFGGPSAGQSTLIHAIDVFLDVDHRPNESEVKEGVAEEETFMSRMSAYMPAPHRMFLNHLSTYSTGEGRSSSIRTLVLNSEEGSELRMSYNSAIRSMENLRNAHSRIALLYIISQSRVEPPEGSSFYETWRSKIESENSKRIRSQERDQREVVEYEGMEKNVKESIDGEFEEVHAGTGGTDLAKFLKRCRQRTVQNLV